MDQHRFHSRRLQAKLFGGECWFCSPLRVLTSCFRFLLKHPKFIYSNDATEELCDSLRGVFANCGWAPVAQFAQIFERNVSNLPVGVPLAVFY